MSDILLHAEPYGSVLLAPEVPCVIIAWKGFSNSAQFRFLMDRGLELYTAEATRRSPQSLGWLADTHDFSAVKEADQEWMRTDWNLRAFAAGIRHVSFVVPESVFGQITVQNYSANAVNSSAYSIEPVQHQTLEQAKTWLSGVLSKAERVPRISNSAA